MVEPKLGQDLVRFREFLLITACGFGRDDRGLTKSLGQKNDVSEKLLLQKVLEIFHKKNNFPGCEIQRLSDTTYQK